MSGKSRAFGKTANFGETWKSSSFVGTGIWPDDIRDSRTWWEGSDETPLNVYWDTLKKYGLNTFSQAARPSHQDRRNRHDIHVIARWKVGVYLAFDDRREAGTIGPWWMGGKKVMDRLVAIPRGRRRVEVAAALCAFLGMATPSKEAGDLPTQAHDFLRRL